MDRHAVTEFDQENPGVRVPGGRGAEPIEEAVRAIRLARVRFTLQMEEPLRLVRYPGSMLRGGFGHALKRIVCTVRHGECERCLVRRQCLYTYIFNTPPPADTEMLRKYPAAPHPYVLEPPLDGRGHYAIGDSLEVGLTLIGNAIDYLSYFILAFEELGQIGLGHASSRFRLTEVYGETGSGTGNGWARIYTGDERILREDFRIRSGADVLTVHDHEHDHGLLAIEFLTPTRLKFENSLTSNLEFHILIRNLLRRLSALSYFHCSKRLNLDFRGLIEQAKGVTKVESRLRWVDWERYSARQQTTMFMGGFVGSVRFAGPIGEFLPLLQAGECLHVGKGTVMGLGQYRIEELNGTEERASSR